MHTGAQIPNGARIGHAVMLGPNAVLTDCRHPHLRDRSREVHVPPIIEDEAILGANCTISAGVVIGRGATVGAGAVVTRDIPPGRTAVGNPARLVPQSAWLASVEQEGSVIHHG